MTEDRKIEVGDAIVMLDAQDEIIHGTVIAINRGWATINTSTGGERKARVSSLEHATEEGEDEEEGGRRMSSTLNRYKPTYKECVTHNGTKSQNNGDELATLLEGMEPAHVAITAAIALGLDDPFALVEKYSSLNPGQIRMNSGNRIRAAVKRGDVTVEDVKSANSKALGMQIPSAA
jgi:predicted HicB family RNase H-like nuclease